MKTKIQYTTVINPVMKSVLTCAMICILLFTQNLFGQTKRALLIGISNYEQANENEWGNIHGTNDIELLLPTLVQQEFKVTHVCDKYATAERIRDEFLSMVKSCKRDDIVYLHFSCHGQPFEDLDGDEEDGWDESIIPYDALKNYIEGKYEGEKHITDDELNVYLNKIRSAVGANGFVCVVVDACHSGGSFRGDEEDDDEPFIRGTSQAFSPNGKTYHPNPNIQGNYCISTTKEMSDIVIIEACRSYQSNYEIKQDGKYYGALSYYVNKSLSTQSFEKSLGLALDVQRLMKEDKRMVRQNMVFETTLKR